MSGGERRWALQWFTHPGLLFARRDGDGDGDDDDDDDDEMGKSSAAGPSMRVLVLTVARQTRVTANHDAEDRHRPRGAPHPALTSATSTSGGHTS